jgi:hypothetical protein
MAGDRRQPCGCCGVQIHVRSPHRSVLYSQTLLYRNALYRIPYVFGTASLNLENFAGYIGKPHYNPIRNDIVRFFGVFRYNKVGIFSSKAIESNDDKTIMPIPTPTQRLAFANRPISPPPFRRSSASSSRSSTPTGVRKNRSSATNRERIAQSSVACFAYVETIRGGI